MGLELLEGEAKKVAGNRGLRCGGRCNCWLESTCKTKFYLVSNVSEMENYR